MIWYFTSVMLLSLLAGIGVKWAVDRVWPPPLYAPQHVPPPAPVPAARKVLELEDTMDVIGSAYQAGQRARPPALDGTWFPDPGGPDPWPAEQSFTRAWPPGQQLPAGGGL